MLPTAEAAFSEARGEAPRGFPSHRGFRCGAQDPEDTRPGERHIGELPQTDGVPAARAIQQLAAVSWVAEAPHSTYALGHKARCLGALQRAGSCSRLMIDRGSFHTHLTARHHSRTVWGDCSCAPRTWHHPSCVRQRERWPGSTQGTAGLSY